MYLDTVKRGSIAIIEKIEGCKQYRSRVMSLGFLPRTTVEMIQNYKFGPVIVRLRGSQITLGRGEAAKIMVNV